MKDIVDGKPNRAYELFDSFVEVFLLGRKNFFKNGSVAYSPQDLVRVREEYVDNFKNEKKSFDEKFKEQTEGLSAKNKEILGHAVWLWSFAVFDMTKRGKAFSVAELVGIEQGDEFDSLVVAKFPKQGIGSAGQWHKQNKYWEIRFNILLFKLIWELEEKGDPRVADAAAIKRLIQDLVYSLKYDLDKAVSDFSWKDPENNRALVMYNLFLHLCDPESFERIFSNQHKRKICGAFSFLIAKDQGDSQDNDDDLIRSIRGELKNCRYPDFDFYSDSILEFIWNTSSANLAFDEIDALRMKRQIILYGPPGTGKTYEARRLAHTLLVRNEIAKSQARPEVALQEILLSTKTESDLEKRYVDRIEILQLHANYTYEDFIWGLKLEAGATVAKQGVFLSLCATARKHPEKDYVLILDEINRVDLARLFGEAFSALEYRDRDIDLSWEGHKLWVPNNLYLIGTMNEIDFSLERIDFALRRRFVWFEYSFNTERLRKMIDARIATGKADSTRSSCYSKLFGIDPEIWNEYAERCSALNSVIDDEPDLGEHYRLGHCFFTDIVDYLARYVGESGYSGKKLINVNLFREGGPAEALWVFSLEPLIRAFLGSMDNDTRSAKVKKMKVAFFNAER
jgi:5-methylcytosine-specific restriction protein B